MQNGLEHQIILENKALRGITFIDIITTSCRLEAFDWAEQFIGQYKNFLDPNQQGQIIYLSWAYWHFYQNEFAEAWEYLDAISFSADYELRAKMLRAQNSITETIHTKANWDATLLELQTFDQFLNSKARKSAHLTPYYLQFIHFAKQFVLWQNKPNRSAWELNLLLTDVQQATELVAKDWLIDLLKTTVEI